MASDCYTLVRDSTRRPVNIDGECAGLLPLLACPYCKQVQAFWACEFPSLMLTPEENAMSLASHKQLTTRKPVKSVDILKAVIVPDARLGLLQHEWNLFKSSLEARLGRPMEILPGAKYGPYTGKCSAKPLDLAPTLGTGVLFHERVLEALSTRGINLKATQAQLSSRGQVLKTHYSVEIAGVSVFSDQTLEDLTITLCQVCREGTRKRPNANADGRWQIRRSAWPKGAHLIRCRDHQTRILVSDEFREAIMSAEFEGMVCSKIGEWI